MLVQVGKEVAEVRVGGGGGSGGGGGDMENRSMMDEKESEIPSPDVNKTTGKFNFRRGHEPVHLLYSIVL